jgi:hypothetical protein
VIAALTNGEIIEHYPTDYPFPSCLVLGLSGAGSPCMLFAGQAEWNCGLYPHTSRIRLNGRMILDPGRRRKNDLFYVQK